MRFIITLLAFVATTAFAQAQTTTWKLDAVHSNVGFSLDHMVVSEVTGKFGKFSIDVNGGAADFNGAVVSASLDISTINTDNERRDGHLKSPDFFDAAKYPTIDLKNGKLEKVSGNKYTLKGDLTMHGVTKPVTFNVVYKGTVTQKDHTKAGFKAEATVNRKDFGLNYNSVLDNGGVMIGEDVRITVNIELNKEVAGK